MSTRCLRPFGSEQNVMNAGQLMSIMLFLESREQLLIACELGQCHDMLRASGRA